MIKINIQLFGWDDISGNDGGDSKDKLEYTTYPEGNTIIRCLDEKPYSRWTHWIPQANGGKGLGITCMGRGCPVCELISMAKANKETPKYNSRKMHSMRVANRTTKRVEINEQGKTFYESLRSIKEEVGDVRVYDIKVIRKGTGKSDTSYTLLPMQPSGSFEIGTEGLYWFKDFTAEDKALIDDTFNFDEFYKPPTKEQILDLLDGKTVKEVFGDKQDETGNDTGDIEVDFTK